MDFSLTGNRAWNRRKLHTKTPIYNTNNLYSFSYSKTSNSTLQFLKLQEQFLRNRELLFYRSVFEEFEDRNGGVEDNDKNYQNFIMRLREVVAEDKNCFKLFSNAVHGGDETLYQFLKHNITLSMTNNTNAPRSNTKPTKDLYSNQYVQVGNRIGTSQEVRQSIDQKGNLLSISATSLEQNRKIKNKKRQNKKWDIYITYKRASGTKGYKYFDLEKIIENIEQSDEYKETLKGFTLETLYDKIIPAIQKELDKERKVFIKDNGFSKNSQVAEFSQPQIAGTLKNFFVEQLNQQFNSNNDPNVKAKLSVAYDYAIVEKQQREMLVGDAVARNSANLYNAFLTMIQQRGGSEIFKEAFRQAWNTTGESEKQLVIEGLKTKNTNMVAGMLGELAGIILIKYLQLKGFALKLASQWVASGKVKNFIEQNRADLLFGNFGIQVKNYRQISIDKGVEVNLHPLQVLQQLSQVLDVNDENFVQLETAFANMDFNSTFAEKIKNSLQQYLARYAGYISNLDFDIKEEVKKVEDTTSFWLVGGNLLIPGSAIVHAITQEVERILYQKEKLNNIVRITFTNVEENDKYYMQDGYVTSEGELAPNFIKYWKRGDGFNGWEYRPAGEQRYSEALASNRVSIHTKILLKNIVSNIKNNGVYSFI